MPSDATSLSRSAVERGNPPTRQKACRGCMKAKRRCDLREPACLRCTNRQVACVYPRKQGRGAPRYTAREATGPSPGPTQNAVADPRAGLATTCAPLPAPATHADEQSGIWPPDLWLLPHSPGPRTVLGDSCLSVPDLSEFASQGPLPHWGLDFPAALEIPDPASDINPCLAMRERMPVGAGVLASPTLRDDLMRTHLQYAIDEVRAGPRSMVLQNGTPWSHPALYRDDTPRCMQDAYTCCALYLSKNDANAPLVLRIINARAAELAKAPLPSEPSALLAYVQAMLLYLILQLLDGDVSARASAESRLQNLQAAVLAMTVKLPPADAVAAMDSTGDCLSLQTSMGLGVFAEARKFWTEWIFEESRRRTCMVAFFFLQAYRLLNGAAEYACYSYEDFPANRLGWTVSAHLWEADSVGQFLRSWGDKKRFHIKRFHMDDVLAYGRPEDLDVYSRMMFTSIMGIDKIESWLGAHGSKLR